MTPAEQKIIDLSAKIVAMRETEGFELAVRELRDAIHAHLSLSRDKVANLAFVVANGSDSKATD